MATHKYIGGICLGVTALVLALLAVLYHAEELGILPQETVLGYETTLFDTTLVHTVELSMEDWEGFLETCENEEYAACDVTIDGERYSNVAIRAKGNTSLSSVAAYGNGRYSFKIEFDHYDGATTYHGLDKLCLNNLIQDNTCMKDYLTYRLMDDFGADAPLCSYVYITVNGEDWGLYLAVEGVEESFLQRNYGADYGELYKPDSTTMGGGRGNGQGFDMEEFREQFEGDGAAGKLDRTGKGGGMGDMPGGQGDMMMGSSDVLLQYIDDEPDSYSNLFDNAKTDPADADKDRLIAALKALGAGEDLESVLDVDEVLRYFVVHNFVCNFDSYTGSMIHNYYLYEEDGRLSMIPWDYNLAFGGFQSSGSAAELVNYPIDTPVSGGSVEDRPMLAWIFASEEYTALYHQYFAEFLALYGENDALAAMIEETAALIAPYVESDPTKFCTYEEFETGAAALQAFCTLRLESIAGQLDGTIPSTSDGQSADSSALIDAGDLTISDMGSMDMGGGMPGGLEGDTPSGGMDDPPDSSREPWMTTDAAQDGQQGADDQPSGKMDRGLSVGMEMGGALQTEGGSAWLWLCVSAAVLLGGILLAWKFRR